MRRGVRLVVGALALSVIGLGPAQEIAIAQEDVGSAQEAVDAEEDVRLAQPEGSDTAGSEETGLDDVEDIDIEDLPPPAEETCFVSRDIDEFDALSNSFVLLEGVRDEYYLLTMFPGCLGLDTSIRIALISDLSRVCANAAPSVAYDSVRGTDTCPIQKIESVENPEAAERLVELRSR